MGGPMLEQSFPERLYPMTWTHAGEVLEELQPMRRIHAGAVLLMKDCNSWEGPHAGAAEKCEEKKATERNPQPPSLCAT